MKITRIVKKNNLNQVMDISVDVYKDNLIFFCCPEAPIGKSIIRNGKPTNLI